MNRIAHFIEMIAFSSRWLVAPSNILNSAIGLRRRQTEAGNKVPLRHTSKRPSV